MTNCFKTYFFFFYYIFTPCSFLPVLPFFNRLDPQLSNNNSTHLCSYALGFSNSSRLCQSCRRGYTRTSGSKCLACGDDGGGSGVGLLILGIVASALLMRKNVFFQVESNCVTIILVLIVRVIMLTWFLFECLLLRHSFQTSSNSVY